MNFLNDIALKHEGDECLIFPFRLEADGYGRIYRRQANGKATGVQAHRWLCERAHGAPPNGGKYDAAHSCGVRGCVNPRHVSWKTHKENIEDKRAHGTWQQGSRIGNAVLDEQKAREIRARSKEPLAALAEEFGVSTYPIWAIRKGLRWTHA